jgi:hypothetical protein
MDEQTTEAQNMSVFDQATADADTSQASGTESPAASSLQRALDATQPDGPINAPVSDDKDPSKSPLNPNAKCEDLPNPPEMLSKAFQWAQDKLGSALPKGPIGDFLKGAANKLAPWNYKDPFGRCPVDKNQ